MQMKGFGNEDVNNISMENRIERILIRNGIPKYKITNNDFGFMIKKIYKENKIILTGFHPDNVMKKQYFDKMVKTLEGNNIRIKSDKNTFEIIFFN